jgi:hypothetical protein
VLEVLNEGKKPKILENIKNIRLSNMKFFRKNDSKENCEN